jgi:hypothetical protein
MLKKVIILIIAASFFATSVSCGTAKEASAEQFGNIEESGFKDETENLKTDVEKNLLEGEEKEDVGVNSNNSFEFPTEGVRPYAVMIDNEGTKSLPQGGLNKAQVIYEIIVEGGETRLMPVYWGTLPELIGPVRSSRHYFLDYAMEHDAVYIHFGWSPMAMNDISKLKINNINGVGYGGEIFWDLTDDKYNWQDSYTSEEKIKGFMSKVKYRTGTEKKPIFVYNKSDVEFSDGQKAEKINLRYSHTYTAGFTYDVDTKTYKRFRKGQPHMERSTGKQLEAKNILIQYVKNNTIKGDTEGRQELHTVGSGEGWLISVGKAIKIKWSKDARMSPTMYKNESGKVIKLNPGQTWVQIVPMFGEVTFE